MIGFKENKNGKTLLRSPRQVVRRQQNAQLKILSFVCTEGALIRQECGLYKCIIKCLVLEEESKENDCYCSLCHTSLGPSTEMVFDILNKEKKYVSSAKVTLTSKTNYSSSVMIIKVSLCYSSFHCSATPFHHLSVYRIVDDVIHAIHLTY